MLRSAPHSLPYFDNGKTQCWMNTPLTCMAFCTSLRNYFIDRDEPVAGSKADHLRSWLDEFDTAIRHGTSEADRRVSKKMFNGLRGGWVDAAAKLALSQPAIVALSADLVGKYCQTALRMQVALGKFHDVKELLMKLLPADLGRFRIVETEGGGSGDKPDDAGCQVILGQEMQPLPSESKESNLNSKSSKSSKAEPKLARCGFRFGCAHAWLPIIMLTSSFCTVEERELNVLHSVQQMPVVALEQLFEPCKVACRDCYRRVEAAAKAEHAKSAPKREAKAKPAKVKVPEPPLNLEKRMLLLPDEKTGVPSFLLLHTEGVAASFKAPNKVIVPFRTASSDNELVDFMVDAVSLWSGNHYVACVPCYNEHKEWFLFDCLKGFGTHYNGKDALARIRQSRAQLWFLSRHGDPSKASTSASKKAATGT